MQSRVVFTVDDIDRHSSVKQLLCSTIISHEIHHCDCWKKRHSDLDLRSHQYSSTTSSKHVQHLVFTIRKWLERLHGLTVFVIPANGLTKLNSITRIIHNSGICACSSSHTSIVFLKPTVSTRPSLLPSGSHKCLRFSFPTLCTLKDFTYFLYAFTYLTHNSAICACSSSHTFRHLLKPNSMNGVKALDG